MWYVRSGEKNLGPYPEAQLREFIAAGKLPLETYILRQGTEQWLRVMDSPLAQPLAIAEEATPANPFDFLQNQALPTSSSPSPRITEPTREQLQNPFWTDFAGQPTLPTIVSHAHNHGYIYRSPETLKAALLVLAVVLAVGHVMVIVSNFFQIELLTKFQQGFYVNNENQAQADADTNDQRHMAIVLGQLGLTLVFAIVFFFWIYRVKANTWALGARGLKITPGWSIGWYFVPFMNLVKPCQAMQEAWKASMAPGDWQRQPGSSLVGFWWFFWISSSILGRASVHLSERAKDVVALLNVCYFDIFSEFYDFLPLVTVTLIILKISNTQVQHSLGAHADPRDNYAR